jgi:hypothetical protein
MPIQRVAKHTVQQQQQHNSNSIFNILYARPSSSPSPSLPPVNGYDLQWGSAWALASLSSKPSRDDRVGWNARI